MGLLLLVTGHVEPPLCSAREASDKDKMLSCLLMLIWCGGSITLQSQCLFLWVIRKQQDHLGRGGPEPPALFSPLPKPLGIYHMGLWTTFGFPPFVPGGMKSTQSIWGQ